TDLGQEKSAERRQKCARPAHRLIVALIFVRKQRPHGDAEEGNCEDPAHPWAAEHAAEQRAGETGGGMVCERGEEDPEDDRHRALKARREHQGQDLRLVADLREADYRTRDEESFHRNAAGGGREMNLGTAPSARPGCRRPMPKVSPILSVACAMAKAKCVDTDPATNARAATPQ